jgi:hypothetical protein
MAGCSMAIVGLIVAAAGRVRPVWILPWFCLLVWVPYWPDADERIWLATILTAIVGLIVATAGRATVRRAQFLPWLGLCLNMLALICYSILLPRL